MSTATIPTPARAVAPGADLSELLYEVVDGVIVEKPPMGSYECGLACRFALNLSQVVDPQRLGQVWVEMLFDFRPIVDRQRRPDVSFTSVERFSIDRLPPRKPAAWRMVPDLAVEIVSPSNPAFEVEEKIEEYFRVGVSRVWIVYPNTARIYAHDNPTTVRIFTRGQALTDEVMFPGFRLDLDKFFGPPDGDDAEA